MYNKLNEVMRSREKEQSSARSSKGSQVNKAEKAIYSLFADCKDLVVFIKAKHEDHRSKKAADEKID